MIVSLRSTFLNRELCIFVFSGSLRFSCKSNIRKLHPATMLGCHSSFILHQFLNIRINVDMCYRFLRTN